MPEIIRVALSGGACSGKTTCIEKLKSYYTSRGIAVFVCPESATQVINSGADRGDMLAFETLVARNQIANEEQIDSAISSVRGGTVLVIYDRGLTDCFGYVDDETALEQNIGVGRVQSWSRYDAVMILQSAEDYQQTDVRCENRVLADYYADGVLRAWMGHPHLRYIRNFPSFDDKIAELCGEINCIVNEQELERKLLIKYPDFSALSAYSPFRSDIEQVYLLSDKGSHRIRKRVSDGVATYFETIKIRISQTLCTEIENIISEKKYNRLMKKADPDRSPIVKSRYCFLYNGQYFELDVFPFWHDRAFLELELRNNDQIIDLPSEIEVIADVSEDPMYKNRNLARLLHKGKLADENS